MWDVIQAEKITSKIDCRLQLADHYLKYEFLTALRQA